MRQLSLVKIKYTTVSSDSESVCQRNSSETARQNFVKLCSYEGHTV